MKHKRTGKLSQVFKSNLQSLHVKNNYEATAEEVKPKPKPKPKAKKKSTKKKKK